MVDTYSWLNHIRALNTEEDFEDSQLDCAHIIDSFLKCGYSVEVDQIEISILSFVGSYTNTLDITFKSLNTLQYYLYHALNCICLQLNAIGRRSTAMTRLHGLDASGSRVFINDIARADTGDQHKPISDDELFK